MLKKCKLLEGIKKTYQIAINDYKSIKLNNILYRRSKYAQ